jgi:SAM-dependent methyltransferase
MANTADTFERSCDHWSEAGRQEMEGFYALASVDYRYLAEAIDWKMWLESRQKTVGPRNIRLLDVACGSGKFPEALTSHAGVANAAIRTIDYALLDPSAFSISEARQALAPPFSAGAEYETTLQGLDSDPGAFDVVWATHALYAIPPAELETAIVQFLHAMRHGGTGDAGGAGFIAHASEKSHYLQFYRHYLRGFKHSVGVPYSSAEQIVAILTRLKVAFEIKEISYTNGAPEITEHQVERYLQRCLFDGTISLKDMRANSITGSYLETCRENGVWRFSQCVSMIFINAAVGSAVE